MLKRFYLKMMPKNHVYFVIFDDPLTQTEVEKIEAPETVAHLWGRLKKTEAPGFLF